jgi:hypothetical protein
MERIEDLAKMKCSGAEPVGRPRIGSPSKRAHRKLREWTNRPCANIPLLKRINESLLSPEDIVTLSQENDFESNLELLKKPASRIWKKE